MVVDIVRVREAGWVLPRFRSCMRKAVRGELHVADVYDGILNRWTRVATLLNPVSKAPMPEPPQIYDVTLLAVRSDYLTLTGFERVWDGMSEREYDYAQTWVVSLPTGEEAG